jgi:hypothetical protein
MILEQQERRVFKMLLYTSAAMDGLRQLTIFTVMAKMSRGE